MPEYPHLLKVADSKDINAGTVGAGASFAWMNVGIHDQNRELAGIRHSSLPELAKRLVPGDVVLTGNRWDAGEGLHTKVLTAMGTSTPHVYHSAVVDHIDEAGDIHVIELNQGGYERTIIPRHDIVSALRPKDGGHEILRGMRQRHDIMAKVHAGLLERGVSPEAAKQVTRSVYDHKRLVPVAAKEIFNLNIPHKVDPVVPVVREQVNMLDRSLGYHLDSMAHSLKTTGSLPKNNPLKPIMGVCTSAVAEAGAPTSFRTNASYANTADFLRSREYEQIGHFIGKESIIHSALDTATKIAPHALRGAAALGVGALIGEGYHMLKKPKKEKAASLISEVGRRAAAGVKTMGTEALEGVTARAIDGNVDRAVDRAVDRIFHHTRKAVTDVAGSVDHAAVEAKVRESVNEAARVAGREAGVAAVDRAVEHIGPAAKKALPVIGGAVALGGGVGTFAALKKQASIAEDVLGVGKAYVDTLSGKALKETEAVVAGNSARKVEIDRRLRMLRDAQRDSKFLRTPTANKLKVPAKRAEAEINEASDWAHSVSDPAEHYNRLHRYHKIHMREHPTVQAWENFADKRYDKIHDAHKKYMNEHARLSDSSYAQDIPKAKAVQTATRIGTGLVAGAGLLAGGAAALRGKQPKTASISKEAVPFGEIKNFGALLADGVKGAEGAFAKQTQSAALKGFGGAIAGTEGAVGGGLTGLPKYNPFSRQLAPLPLRTPAGGINLAKPTATAAATGENVLKQTPGLMKGNFEVGRTGATTITQGKLPGLVTQAQNTVMHKAPIMTRWGSAIDAMT